MAKSPRLGIGGMSAPLRLPLLVLLLLVDAAAAGAGGGAAGAPLLASPLLLAPPPPLSFGAAARSTAHCSGLPIDLE
jgi:hypothetical protein